MPLSIPFKKQAQPGMRTLHNDELEDIQTVRGMFPQGRPTAAPRPVVPLKEKKVGLWGQAMRSLDQYHYNQLVKKNATSGLYGDERRDAQIAKMWGDRERLERGEYPEEPRDSRRPVPAPRRARTPTHRRDDYEEYDYDAPRGSRRARTPGPDAEYDYDAPRRSRTPGPQSGYDYDGPQNFGGRAPSRGRERFDQGIPQGGFGGQGFQGQGFGYNQPQGQYGFGGQSPAAFGPGASVAGGYGGQYGVGYAQAPTVYDASGPYGYTGAGVQAYDAGAAFAPTVTYGGAQQSFGAVSYPTADATFYAQPAGYGGGAVYGGGVGYGAVAQPYAAAW